MTDKPYVRTGGGYVCKKCKTYQIQMENMKKDYEELKNYAVQCEDDIHELREKIERMVEEKATEDLNVMSRLEELTNIANSFMKKSTPEVSEK